MKIIPIINSDFIYRYRVIGNTVVDTFTSMKYTQASTSKAQDLLKKLNTIGKQNAEIIDMGQGKAELLSVFA